MTDTITFYHLCHCCSLIFPITLHIKEVKNSTLLVIVNMGIEKCIVMIIVLMIPHQVGFLLISFIEDKTNPGPMKTQYKICVGMNIYLHIQMSLHIYMATCVVIIAI